MMCGKFFNEKYGMGQKSSKVIMSQPSNKRGRPVLAIPDDLIRELSAQGLSSRTVANKLKIEHGIELSYKTVQRLLSGKRGG